MEMDQCQTANSAFLCVERATYIKAEHTINIPDNPKDWINSYANISEVVANIKSYDLVIYVNFLGKIWIDIRKHSFHSSCY